jgi:hypothetical protein
MTKAKIKEEIKKPDPLLSIFQHFTDWVKTNTKTCILAAAAIVVVCLCGVWRVQEGETRRPNTTLSRDQKL